MTVVNFWINNNFSRLAFNSTVTGSAIILLYADKLDKNENKSV